MALYFLTYDLRKQRDYKNLYEVLKDFAAVRIFESTWCFNRIDTSARGLRVYFQSYIDSDDGLIVSEVSNWSSYNADGTPNEL